MNQESSNGAASGNASNAVASRSTRTRKTHANNIYAIPLPLTIYPTPTFTSHNPLSILQILWHSISLWWSEASSHPQIRYKACVSRETQSVHITNPETIRLLWTHGFFGKGSLSRSEPSWLEREKARRGISAAQTSEDVTQKRRAERKEFKKERAKKEREAIEKQLQDEGKVERSEAINISGFEINSPEQPKPSKIDVPTYGGEEKINTLEGANGSVKDRHAIPSEQFNGRIDESERHTSDAVAETASVPSQEKPNDNKRGTTSESQATSLHSDSTPITQKPIANQEHLQLTPEEAFFLVYGLGILEIWEEGDTAPISTTALFHLFRRWSSFPPRPSIALRTDDPFLLSYVVYHHFRSLGWVVRSGVEFGVDYLLYNRGPVFSRAEFAAVIVPSYSDPYFFTSAPQAGNTKMTERKPWHWLHCVNRVQSQVRKSLLLVFVEVPPPLDGQQLESKDIGPLLKSFRVREISIKGWTPNRTRD